MSSYHGWTHAPKAQGGTDPIPPAGGPSFFRAYFMRYTGSPQTTAFTGIGTTNIQVRYDWWETSDSTVFEPRAYIGFSNPPVMSTDLVGSVRLYQPGHYTIAMGMLLNDTVNDHKQEWNDSDSPFGYPDGVYGGGTSDYNVEGFLIQTITRIYPLPDYVGDPPNAYWPTTLGSGGFVTGSVTVGSRNTSGLSDNELELAFLEILFTPFTIPPA